MTNVIDPLGGSYFVEALTDRIEARAEEYFAEDQDVSGKGSILEGVLVGIERGWFQSEIADAAFREQMLYEKGKLVKVGVNEFVTDHDEELDVLKISAETRAIPGRRRCERCARAATGRRRRRRWRR